MSISMLLSQIKSLETGITSINKKIDAQKLKEAKAIEKIAKAQKKSMGAKTISTISSAQREYQSASKELTSAQAEQVKLSKQLVDKSKGLTNKQSDLMKAQAKEREQHQKAMETLQQKALATQKSQIQEIIKVDTDNTFLDKKYDVFISHASEDKDDFVEPLARALQEAGIDTWYDSDQIGWGQSIRQSIDKGLINSRFCLIVLSQSFLKKYWTNYELNGIFQKDATTDGSVILPIWHNVTRDEIQKLNLTLTDMLAMNTAIHSTEDIVRSLKELVDALK
ncbi:TIR domain-containing protein [Sporosarcina limicola]|uniref:ADP-ribosyl cyclase/cyclic ADP-ribose hydrolase n=1 Tax=Sporosarcina limicola TaxID=34101 RepID=A0A927RFM5_9BACL|nr:TIR domain-containing protein [Sporosarcina limicola]MBE1555662.1 small-conductance mechanosensitive channel [Sporosarcina limicola]